MEMQMFISEKSNRKVYSIPVYDLKATCGMLTFSPSASHRGLTCGAEKKS